MCRVQWGAGGRGGAGDVRGSEGVAGELRKAEMLTLARIYKALNAFPRVFYSIYSGKALKVLKRKTPCLDPDLGRQSCREVLWALG